MKNIIVFILIFFLTSCEKEQITSHLEFENLYEIYDNPNDPIQSRIYKIFKQYGVPIYFRDTIGRIFVKNDNKGNPVYNYEFINLAYSFNNNNRNKYTYKYITDKIEMESCLDLAEHYLKSVAKPLYPFSFFFVKEIDEVNILDKHTQYKNGDYISTLQTMAITLWQDESIDGFSENLKISMTQDKIQNFTGALSFFYDVSNIMWYNSMWKKLNPNYNDYIKALIKENPKQGLWIFHFSPTILEDGGEYTNKFTEEQLPLVRNQLRSQIGVFGFISGGGLYSPKDYKEDVNLYTMRALRISRKDFEDEWRAYPLVMKKYDIIYNILTKELGFKL